MKDMKWLWIALALGLGVALVLFWRKKEHAAPQVEAPSGQHAAAKSAKSNDLLSKETKELQNIERKVSEMGLALHMKYKKHGEGGLRPETLQELEKDVQEVFSEIEQDLKSSKLTDKERNLLKEFKKRLGMLLETLKAKSAVS